MGRSYKFRLWDLALEVFSKREGRGFITLEKKKTKNQRDLLYMWNCLLLVQVESLFEGLLFF